MRAFISLLFILTGLVISYPQTTTASTSWWNQNWKYRTPLTLSATNGTDAVITLPISLTTLKQKSGSTNDLVPESFRIINHEDNSLLTSQLGNKNTTTNTIEISFYLPGDAASATPYLYFDSETPAASQPQIPSLITHTQQQFQGQETYMITTPRATYSFQKQAGGLASIFDRDNRDWISFNTSAGSAGMYRGIPNLVYPGDIFHPGYHHATTTITTQCPLYLELKSTAQAGAWETIWRFYPTTAQLQVTKTPQAAKYWFLYEGTPGGTISTNAGAMDKYTLADGTSSDITATKGGDLSNPEWLYFQDPALNRSFFLLHHEDDTHTDKYYLMENNMTVFGFGRDGLNKYLTGQNSFTLGFVENKTHATVAKAVTTQLSPPTVGLGNVERQDNATKPWDLNNDSKIDIFDFSYVVKEFGSSFGIFHLQGFVQALGN